jgi:hypothetical protein
MSLVFCEMIDREWWVDKDLEGGGSVNMKVISWHSFAETKENHEPLYDSLV